MEENSYNNSIIESAAMIIYKDFSIPFDDEKDISKVLDNLKDILADRIQYLLMDDPEQLFRILYRIDVDQKKVDLILASDKFLDVPVQLAELVIDRQIAKIKTREKYKNPDKKSDNSDRQLGN